MVDRAQDEIIRGPGDQSPSNKAARSRYALKAIGVVAFLLLLLVLLAWPLGIHPLDRWLQAVADSWHSRPVTR